MKSSQIFTFQEFLWVHILRKILLPHLCLEERRQFHLWPLYFTRLITAINDLMQYFQQRP